MNAQHINLTYKWILSVIISLAICSGVNAKHYDAHDERTLKEDPRLAPGQLAPVLSGLGDHHHEITTSSERAQLFFDQGLKLTYGFNHKEALRSFKEAARLDPDCAMAYWGLAVANELHPKRAAVYMRHAISRLSKQPGITQRERDWLRIYHDFWIPAGVEPDAPVDPAAERARRRRRVQALEELARRYPESVEARAFLLRHLILDEFRAGVPLQSRFLVDLLADEIHSGQAPLPFG